MPPSDAQTFLRQFDTLAWWKTLRNSTKLPAGTVIQTRAKKGAQASRLSLENEKPTGKMPVPFNIKEWWVDIKITDICGLALTNGCVNPQGHHLFRY